MKWSLDYYLCLVFTKTDPGTRIWVKMEFLRGDSRKTGAEVRGAGEKANKGCIQPLWAMETQSHSGSSERLCRTQPRAVSPMK